MNWQLILESKAMSGLLGSLTHPQSTRVLFQRECLCSGLSRRFRTSCLSAKDESSAKISAPPSSRVLGESPVKTRGAKKGKATAKKGRVKSVERVGAAAVDVDIGSTPQEVYGTSVSEVEHPKLGLGQLELIVGPMFSGKTTELIKRLDIARRVGRHVIAIKSEIDTRYAVTKDHRSYIVCHSGGKVECFSVKKLSVFKEKFREEYEKCEVLAIDEAQFFPDLVDFCTNAVDIDGKAVLVAGLDGDFRRKPFQAPNRSTPIMKLIPLSDKIDKFCAQCMYCNKKAPFTLRTIREDKEVLVGGADSYVPVCRKHYLEKWREIHDD